MSRRGCYNVDGRRPQFSKEEDEKLIKIVNKHGAKNWPQIGKLMKTRTGRQCRDRYQNYLKPGCNNKDWTKEEDDLIMEKVDQLGSKWSLISNFLEGRTGCAIKNRYTLLIRKKFGKPPRKALATYRNAPSNMKAMLSESSTDSGVEYPSDESESSSDESDECDSQKLPKPILPLVSMPPYIDQTGKSPMIKQIMSPIFFDSPHLGKLGPVSPWRDIEFPKFEDIFGQRSPVSPFKFCLLEDNLYNLFNANENMYNIF